MPIGIGGNMVVIERWIVQEWNAEYEYWQPWVGCGQTREWRFWSYHNARKGYEEHKKDFHYSPCMYRFCMIEIQPETTISTKVHSTIQLGGEEINLTQTAEAHNMKFT